MGSPEGKREPKLRGTSVYLTRELSQFPVATLSPLEFRTDVRPSFRYSLLREFLCRGAFRTPSVGSRRMVCIRIRVYSLLLSFRREANVDRTGLRQELTQRVSNESNKMQSREYRSKV